MERPVLLQTTMQNGFGEEYLVEVTLDAAKLPKAILPALSRAQGKSGVATLANGALVVTVKKVNAAGTS